jgi:aerobic-type carbon monoxide dehydrogenase small subunit (CoxS/CutS family)
LAWKTGEAYQASDRAPEQRPAEMPAAGYQEGQQASRRRRRQRAAITREFWDFAPAPERSIIAATFAKSWIGLEARILVPTLQEKGKGKMSKEEDSKTEPGNKESSSISRRHFLRDAGLVVGAAPALGSLAITTEALAHPPQQAKAPAANEATAPTAAVAPGATIPIEITVNGGKYRLAVEPHWSLRQVIRDQVGYTSPKDWCGGQGACGSCTVIMNGRPILSCLTLACECDGAKIETAEGIAKAKHPIIQAYIDNNAFQCGYCTPGFVATAKALLDKNSNPTEADVRDALGGNLCRCATYQRHPPAVLQAARSLKQKDREV